MVFAISSICSRAIDVERPLTKPCCLLDVLSLKTIGARVIIALSSLLPVTDSRVTGRYALGSFLFPIPLKYHNKPNIFSDLRQNPLAYTPRIHPRYIYTSYFSYFFYDLS